MFDINREFYTSDSAKENRNYYKGNYASISDDIDAVNWDETLLGKDIDEAWDTFERIITFSIDRNIPKSHPRTRNKKKWMTRDAESAIRDKHKAYNKYRKNKSQPNLENYKKAKNQATLVVRAARESFESRLADNIKDNPKEFWAYVKSQTGIVSGIAPLQKQDGSLAVEGNEKANTLNTFFSSVFTKEDMDNIPSPDPITLKTVINNVNFSESIILKEIKDMKSGRSAGPDGIHPCVLKETSSSIAKPLKLIFEKSMLSGQLPKAWKDAIVIPIFKKGKRSSNYRPVSLTSVCGKLMERIVRKDMLAHIEHNQLFSEKQHGFRAGMSCTTQLLTVTEQWTTWHDEHTPFDCVYLDYKKAFDSVPHSRLLRKIQAFGIEGNLYSWIESFLTDRRQRVRVDDSLSGWENVTSGIPQGSVLGPSLFLIFINDLPDGVDSITALFADDTKVYRPVNTDSDIQQLQVDIDTLYGWSTKWQLPFNEGKCKLLHYGRNNPKTQYTIGESEISSTVQEKDLGVVFDPTLTFSEHHDKAVAKANSRLGLIKRSFKKLKPKPFVNLYKTLVRPIVEYCTTVTNPVLKRDDINIEKVQRRATKLVEGLQDMSYDDRLKELKLQSLSDRRVRADMLQTFRIIRNIDNLDEDTFFTKAHDTRTRGNGYKLFKKHCNTNIRKNAFSQRTIERWNDLPSEVVSATTINRFKSGLRKHWRNDTTPDCDITKSPNSQTCTCISDREDNQHA
jgi:hypothetical protein